jgi:3-carboxy-cis,cis-muconate cycloisomerase
LLPQAIEANEALRERCDIAQLRALFDPAVAAEPARRLADQLLAALRQQANQLDKDTPQ